MKPSSPSSPSIDKDKKYRTRDGRPARVVCVDRKGEQPVLALIPTENGVYVVEHFFNDDGSYLLSRTPHKLDLIEIKSYEDWEIDDKVLVSNDGITWICRHFAGLTEAGQPTVWYEGRTSWSEPCRYTPLLIRKAGAEEELK